MADGKGEQLRALMAAGGWKPADVARLLGRNVQTVYSWLTRPERIPPDVLRLLALELRVRELERGLYGTSKIPKPAKRITVKRAASMAKGPVVSMTSPGRNRRRG